MFRNWTISVNNQRHSDRVAFMRPISYEMSAWPEHKRHAFPLGQALSLNISSSGILLLSDVGLDVQQVLKIFIPSVLDKGLTPILAAVRWARPIPFDTINRLYFSGLKFII